MSNRTCCQTVSAKFISVTFIALCLFLGGSAAKGDWKSDANARIEQNRKRSAEILVVDLGGNPIPNVSIQSDQLSRRFAFGTCIRVSQMNNTIYKNFILSHFNWAVCENDTKWGANEPTRDNETYTNADTIYTWCNNNGIKMRGHTLFWEQQNSEFPNWLAALSYATYPTSSDLLTEVDERITSAVNHYKNKYYNWDVDNEMLTDSFFTTRLGSAGIVHMFNAAKAIDPNCGMFMNEYNGNSFGGYDSEPYVTRANSLISQGATIDGYGIQAHLVENATFDPTSYYNNVLQPLAVFNKPIWATEFDASHTNRTTSADNIENFMRICFSHANVEGIMFWGFMDGQMWRTNAGLCDSSGNLTEGGVRYEALMAEWTTNDSNASNASGKVNFRGFHGAYDITLVGPNDLVENHTIELVPGSSTQQFILQMNISGVPDTTAPTPNPMTWASNPAATGPYSITMTATTATDNSGVEYFFDCLTAGGHDSNWQLSTIYQDAGLSPNTQYTYQVKARDRSSNNNETAFSATRSATTWPPDTTAPTPNPMTWSSVPTATGAYTITMTATTATDANNPPVQYYFECTTDGSKTSSWQSSPTYVASGLNPSTSYSFRAEARDSAPALNTTGWSSSLSATTSATPTNITILGSWVTGTTHAKEAGGNRALIFIAHVEEAGTISLNSVTYGGQPMTKVIDRIVGTNPTAYVAAYILNETGVAAATSNTFNPTWSTTPDAVGYSSVFLQNVNQTVFVGATDSNGTAIATPNPIKTNPLSTSNGDMVILGATCGNTGSYTLQNGFTEGSDQTMGSTATATGVTGHKAATGAAETPSATHSNANRQVIVGFVVKAGVPVDTAPAAPTGLAATAGNGFISLNWNDNSEADMNGYNVYRSMTQGSAYVKLNSSLLTSSDYLDNGLTNGMTYYYVVTAVDDASNESGYSSEANAVPTYQTCADVFAGGHRLAADISGSGDCYVNYDDLATFVEYWLNEDCVSSGNCHGADFAPIDGTVDFFDFSDLAEQWMQCNNPQDPGCTPNW